MYELKRRVRFYETDGMYVVYHGNYLNWLEEARVEYLRTAYIVLDDWIRMGLVFPIVELHIKYLQSARYDDDVTVRTWLVDANRVKLVFRYEIVRDSTGEVLVKAETTGTFTRMDNGHVARVPKEQIAELLRMSEEDKVNYHE